MSAGEGKAVTGIAERQVVSLSKKKGVLGGGGGGNDCNCVVMSWTNNLTYSCLASAVIF